jgi:membrane protein required for colicin V production
MSWLDLVLGVILITSLISGIRKGMIRMGIGLAALALAMVLAFWSYRSAGELFSDWTSSPPVANLIGFCAVFFGVIAAGSILSMVLTRVFKWMGLSWLDRLLGGAFGLARGAVMATIVLMVFTALAPGNPPKAVGESVVAPYLMGFAEVLSSLAPDDLRKRFDEAYKKVKSEYWDPVKKSIKVIDQLEKMEKNLEKGLEKTIDKVKEKSSKAKE